MTDTTAARLLDLVRAKQERGEDVQRNESAPGKAPVVDLLAVLQRSLGAKPERRRHEASAGDLTGLSRSQLYERAKALNIPGRSAMSRDDPVQAIRAAA